MSERRFVLVDFTHMSRVACLKLYEAGHVYILPRALAHAATSATSSPSSGQQLGSRRACSACPRC